MKHAGCVKEERTEYSTGRRVADEQKPEEAPGSQPGRAGGCAAGCGAAGEREGALGPRLPQVPAGPRLLGPMPAPLLVPWGRSRAAAPPLGVTRGWEQSQTRPPRPALSRGLAQEPAGRLWGGAA